MVSIFGRKRSSDNNALTSNKKHCDYEPCLELAEAHQIGIAPKYSSSAGLNITDEDEMEVELTAPAPHQNNNVAETANMAQAVNMDTVYSDRANNIRVYTSMPGNNSFGPRYISAPYVTSCGACSNGASGHINHALT